jgi:hypothetical protein
MNKRYPQFLKTIFMKQNIGISDGIIRVMLAIVLFTLSGLYVLTGGWGIVSWCLAAILLYTSISGFCPLYALFGICTRSKKKHAH